MTVPSRLEEFFREEMKDALYITTGRSWNTQLEDVPRENLCDSVANEFAVAIESEFDYVVESPVKAPVDGAKHFVAVVTDTPEGVLDEPIVVDGTITQFDESHPEIIVATLNDAIVEEVYDEVRL